MRLNVRGEVLLVFRLRVLSFIKHSWDRMDFVSTSLR